MPQMDWFPKWIQAYSKFYDKQYSEAIRLFKQLEDLPSLRNDVSILVSLGQAQYYRGDYPAAALTLQRVHRWIYNIVFCLVIVCARKLIIIIT